MKPLLPLLLLGLALLPAQAAEPLRPEQEPIVLAVQKVLPAVVNIYTEQTVEVRDPFDIYFENYFGGGGIYRGNRIVRQPLRSLGSGLLVSEDGYIVTNEHVVSRAPDLKVRVTFHDKTDLEAKVVRRSEDSDLALIKVTTDQKLIYFPLNTVSPNLLGQTVIAIGNPIGYELSVSSGILSAKDRSLPFGDTVIEGLLQTDAAINPGNSGGPLIDISGNLVGLNNAKMNLIPDPQGGIIPVQNIGFAIPADRVKAFVEESMDIISGKKPAPPEENLLQVIKAKLGLDLQEINDDLANAFAVRPHSGLLVSGVEKGSPAEKVGIEKGMVITAIGSKLVQSPDDIPRPLIKAKPGDPVKITLTVNQRRGAYIVQRVASVILEAR